MSAPKPVQIDALPKSVEEFVALRDQIAQTPEGGAAMMILALHAYTEDEELGRQCLTIAVDRDRLQEGPDGYKGWQLRRSNMQRIKSQLQRQAYIPKSYIKGATPENGYQLPAPPHVFTIADNPYSGDPASGKCKLFVVCSGADSPRPVALKRNNRGIWKASEWSSLIVGMRAPAKEVDDDL